MNCERAISKAILLAAILCLWQAGALTARADEVQVSASVSDNTAEVNESVDYTIKISGATEANVPENIPVDGLTITYVGPSTQTQISFGSGFGSGSHIQRSVTHTYSVVPDRPGQFVIPPQQVVVGGKNYTTQAVTLRVNGTASSGGSSTPGRSAPAAGGVDANGRLFYAEFVLPQNTLYVGEAMPIEVRLYVDASVRAQLEEAPEITAEGCTMQKLTKPAQSEVTRNGREYVMVTYKTALTPAKAGSVTLGPVTVQAVAQLPQPRAHRHTGSPFDDPIFQNPFFNDPFGSATQQKQITIRGEPVELTVIPLPAQGQPRSFAGAVGNFSLATSVRPTMIEAGDPLTVTARITGRGDFDRVTAPQIVDTTGWKTYPPSAKFEPDDDVGISGTKAFQLAVIPEGRKTESPAVEWSYFDPIKESYVTLTGTGAPIRVEGEPQATAAPVVAQQTPAATPAPADILYIRADSTGWGRTFEPLYASRLFWAVQGAPLLALLTLAGVHVRRRRAADEEARKRDQWRREKDAALGAMQRREAPESELYEAAAKAMRLEAAIQTGRSPETLDGAEVARVRVLDETLAGRVRELFERQAEVLYAGTSGGGGAATSQARIDLLDTVKAYEHAKPAA